MNENTQKNMATQERSTVAEAPQVCSICHASIPAISESMAIEGESVMVFSHDQEVQELTVQNEAAAHVSRHGNRFTVPFNVFGPAISLKL